MRLGSGVAVAVVYRLATTAPFQPLAWEPPLAMGAALKSKKKKKKKKKRKKTGNSMRLALSLEAWVSAGRGPAATALGLS